MGRQLQIARPFSTRHLVLAGNLQVFISHFAPVITIANLYAESDKIFTHIRKVMGCKVRLKNKKISDELRRHMGQHLLPACVKRCDLLQNSKFYYDYNSALMCRLDYLFASILVLYETKVHYSNGLLSLNLLRLHFTWLTLQS